MNGKKRTTSRVWQLYLMELKTQVILVINMDIITTNANMDMATILVTQDM
jgi:hypothetical protein